MRKVKIEEAVGLMLAHDLTRIIPGVEKGPLFQRGHVLAAADIPLLLDIGKKHIFVLDGTETEIHEDEAGQRIAQAVMGDHIRISDPSEGKVNLISTLDGILKIDPLLLDELLDDPEICFSTATPDFFYKAGSLLASCRIIPLMKAEDSLIKLEAHFKSERPLISIAPIKPQRIGLVITGSEIAEGRIQDAFGPLLTQKNQSLGAEIVGLTYPGDDQGSIEQSILNFLDQGCTMVQLTGGMSVDPDDCTKFAISEVCDETILYGTSVLPGAMFMLAYKDGHPVIGLPGGVIASKFSIFDFVVPRLFAEEKLTRKDFKAMALGGLINARR